MPNINMRDCRIVFMGTPAFAVAILQAMLAQRWGVVAVITQPDRPVGGGTGARTSGFATGAVAPRAGARPTRCLCT